MLVTSKVTMLLCMQLAADRNMQHMCMNTRFGSEGKIAAFRETPAVAPPGSRGQAVVVGAGPAGCVAAMFLTRQGFSVKVRSVWHDKLLKSLQTSSHPPAKCADVCCSVSRCCPHAHHQCFPSLLLTLWSS